MISKVYFEETYSLVTAQTLQAWANDNLIAESYGDFGMRIDYLANPDDEMFAETEVTGLVQGNDYTLKLYVYAIRSNSFKIYINELPNDNTSAIKEEGWEQPPVQRTIDFTATQETMYIAIGDTTGAPDIYSIVDNVSIKSGVNELISNGSFETDTTGWYAQNGNATLSLYEYSPTSENDYLEDVVIPAYDSGNTEHVLITTSNGNDSLLNESGKINFYVEPGDYSGGTWTLSASGTDVKRRTISLYNGNDTHPGKLSVGEVAQFQLYFNGASYWTVDRPASISNPSTVTYLFKNGSTHNVINRAYGDGDAESVWIYDTCDDNTIQSCRFQDMPHNYIADDRVCIQWNDWGLQTWTVKNTKVLDCEIRNMNDGLQTTIHTISGQQTVNCEGTIIDGNHIFITDALYTDGNGNFTPSGTYAFAENAIDLKAGSLNASNPMIITNNKMWGYRNSDNSTSSPDDPGYALIGHYGIGNLKMNNNVIFDSHIGFCFADSGDATYSSYDGEVKSNLVYDCGDKQGGVKENIIMNSCSNINMQDNEIVQGTNAAARFSYCRDIVWTNNTLNNTPAITINNDNNGTYTPNIVDDVGYTADYVFTTDNYTTSPREITLTNAVKP